MQRPVRVVFSSIPVPLTLFAEELGVGWGGAGVNRSQCRETCQDDRGKGKGKTGVHFEIGFQRLLWVDADPVLLDILALLHELLFVSFRGLDPEVASFWSEILPILRSLEKGLPFACEIKVS